MQIERVHLKRYRGFRDFIVPIGQFTNMVGLNSKG